MEEIINDKKLKRKEKEFNELLLAYHATDDQRKDLEEHYKKLEKECEELRKCVDTLSITREKLIGDLSNSIDSLGLANKKVNQYYQVLQEIKEKSKKYNANVGDTIIANPIQDLYDIYKIISEVENGRNNN